jgi:GT2 family glycosyltransferase
MITASIVLFNNDFEILKKTVNSFLNISVKKKLYLIDNSNSNKLEAFFKSSEIEYLFVGKNIGFGAAHNLVLNKLCSNFHLILNPDVVFSVGVISSLITALNENPTVAFVTPKVRYPSVKPQYICRKHPTLFDLLNRKLKISNDQFLNREYRDRDLQKPFYPDFIHGCFMLFNTTDLKNLKGFDERFFLYMEDADICRRIDEIGKKKLYYPKVEIIHHHQQGSSKSIKLFIIHTSSAIKYFLKWGFN